MDFAIDRWHVSSGTKLLWPRLREHLVQRPTCCSRATWCTDSEAEEVAFRETGWPEPIGGDGSVWLRLGGQVGRAE